MKLLQLSEEVTLEVFFDRKYCIDGGLVDLGLIEAWFDSSDSKFKNTASSFYWAIFLVARFFCLQKKNEKFELFWIDVDAPSSLTVTKEMTADQIEKFLVADPDKECYAFKITPGFRKGVLAFDKIQGYFKKLACIDRKLRPSRPMVSDGSGFSEQRWSSKPEIFCNQVGIQHLNINSTFSNKPELSVLEYYRSEGYEGSFCECASLHMAVISMVMSAAFDMADKLEPILLKLMQYLKDPRLDSDEFKRLDPKARLINQFGLWRTRIFGVLQPVAQIKNDCDQLPLTKVTNFQTSKLEQELLDRILSKFENSDSIQGSLLSYDLVKGLYHPMPYKPEPNDLMVRLIISRANPVLLKQLLIFKPDIFDRMTLPTGWPDLVILSETGELKMVEVKSHTDKISKSQKRFFTGFSSVIRESLVVASIGRVNK